MSSTPTHTAHPSVTTDPVLASQLYDEAYAETSAEREALDASDLMPMNFDVRAAAITAAGAAQRIATIRDSLVKLSAHADIARIDRIALYARALFHAQNLYQTANVADNELQVLYEEAVALRDVMHTDLLSLAKRGTIEGKRLKDYKGLVGFRNVATDLGLIVTLAKDYGSTVFGKTSITEAEIDRAGHLISRIVDLTSARDLATPETGEAASNRQRAATLLFGAYDEARRVIAFVRNKEDDVDTFAPSLFGGRGIGGRSKRDATDDDATQPLAGSAASTAGASLDPANASSRPYDPSAPGAPNMSPFV